MAEPSSELIQRAQRGERTAIAELVASQQRYVYSVAMTIMRNPPDAADLTQDAFIRLMRALPTYRAETKFTTWLYRLVVNLGLDELRRRSRRLEPITLDDDAAPDPPDTSLGADPLYRATSAEETERVRRAVQKLPVSQRLALTFYYFEDMSYDEIAEAMDIPLNTVKSHIHRAKARLAGSLQGQEVHATHEVATRPQAANRRGPGATQSNLRFACLGAVSV